MGQNLSSQHQRPLLHHICRIKGSLWLEKTFKIIKCNHHPALPGPRPMQWGLKQRVSDDTRKWNPVWTQNCRITRSKSLLTPIIAFGGNSLKWKPSLNSQREAYYCRAASIKPLQLPLQGLSPRMQFRGLGNWGTGSANSMPKATAKGRGKARNRFWSSSAEKVSEHEVWKSSSKNPYIC